MTELLCRLFIKNSKNTNNPDVRRSYGTFAGVLGIVLNIILFAVKCSVGILTASISVVADALNNLSDAGSSVITLIGFKISGKPADSDHPFGHGRAEYISAVFVSVLILMMGFSLAKDSGLKILNPGELKTGTGSVIVLITAVFVKLWMYFFNRKIGKKINSESLNATAKDALSDAVATSAVIAAIVVSKVFSVNLDGYAGIVVSLFIIYTGYESIKDAISPLIGLPADKDMVEKIEKTVMSYEVAKGIHDLVIHNYGPSMFMISLHVEVPCDGDILKMHDEIDIIERRLAHDFNCVATIHMDPIETETEAIAKAKEIVVSVIKGIDESLTMHDFRMVSGQTHTNLIFDVVIGGRCKFSPEALKAEIGEKMKEADEKYICVIQVDRKYS